MATRESDTRRRLVDATAEVVRRVGYQHATTRAIAEAAGVAEGTMYRHFADKQELFLEAILVRNASVIEWMAELPGRAGTATVRENLTDALGVLATLRDDILPLELGILSDPELADARRRAVDPANGYPPPVPFTALVSYLTLEQRLCRVRADVDPRGAATVLLASLMGLALLPPTPAQPDGAVALSAVVDLLLDGIGAAGP
jgi:AcrR family transcriptional regulator